MTPKQVRRLLRAAERRLGPKWRLAINALKRSMSLKDIAALIENGQLAEAMQLGTTTVQGYFQSAWLPEFTNSANQAALFLQRATGVPVVFDQVNFRAVDVLNRNKLRMVRGFTSTQTESTMQAIRRSFANGQNPIQTAREIKNSIGLTPRQEKAVARYREALENGDRRALRNELRDRRFDRTVDAATGRGAKRRLTPKQIDRMVDRYRERYLGHRAKTIARTEALRSIHQGQAEMYSQAIADGTVQANQLKKEWETAKDGRVRDSHADMHGQIVQIDEPFISGLGNQLMFPGDPSAPPEDTITCRCAQGTRIVEISVGAAA